VAREVVATRPDIVLQDVELVNLPTGPVLIASIESPRLPNPSRIARFEALLRERLGEQRVRVIVRAAESVDITSKGRILFGGAHFGGTSEEEARRRRTIEETVRANLQGLPDTFVTAIDAVRQDSGWAVRARSWVHASLHLGTCTPWRNAPRRQPASPWTWQCEPVPTSWSPRSSTGRSETRSCRRIATHSPRRTRDHREQPSRPQLSREPVSAVSGSQDPVAANSTTDERASTR